MKEDVPCLREAMGYFYSLGQTRVDQADCFRMGTPRLREIPFQLERTSVEQYALELARSIEHFRQEMFEGLFVRGQSELGKTS
jgi:hypothetical protein